MRMEFGHRKLVLLIYPLNLGLKKHIISTFFTFCKTNDPTFSMSRISTSYLWFRVVLIPKKKDFNHIDEILINIEKLKCDMYDSSLLPIALANKLASLSDHPSAVLSEKFAKEGIK